MNCTSNYYKTCNLPTRFEYPNRFRNYGIQKQPPDHPLYRRTSSTYGYFPPDIHTVPKVYYPLSQKFTLELSNFVNESPSWTKKNLTGIARQLKDNAADLYNCVQKWNEHHSSGVKVLNNIRDIKCSAIENKAEDLNLFPEGLETLCNTLTGLYDQMSEQVNHIKVINKQYEALEKLQDLKENHEPVFLTWQMHHFVELSKDVAESYEKQLALNNYTKENIAFSTNKDSVDFYRISWLYQPFIDENLDFQIECLLKETGYK